jgi:hypothetical protein
LKISQTEPECQEQTLQQEAQSPGWESEKRVSTKYDRFRTGLTFDEVRQMLWSPSGDPKDWRRVTRHTVLGKWREIKLQMYNEAFGDDNRVEPTEYPF